MFGACWMDATGKSSLSTSRRPGSSSIIWPATIAPWSSSRNGLRNVPSTKSSLRSPDLETDVRFSVFLDIFDHPRSATTPITAASADYQAIVLTFTTAWQAGGIADLATGL